MKKFIICLMAVLCVGLCTAAAANVPTEAEAYQKIIAMKSQYPEGRAWTNSHRYDWNGGSYGAGGCMGFAFMMSDAAFGNLPARDIYPTSGNPITLSDLRVGDILRLPGHSVVVLEKHSDHIIVTEGNYQRKVHWGRKISAAKVKTANYYTTRYPVGYTEPKAAPAPAPKPAEPKKVAVTRGGITYQIADISGHWAQEHIKACITSNLLSTKGDVALCYFRPNESTTRAEVITALYRAKGSPKPAYESSFTDVTEDWYKDAVSWAVASGIVNGVTQTSFAPDAPITREQLALIMYRFSGSEDASVELSAFADSASVSEFARAGVSWAVKSGIISGKNGKLEPTGETTRAEFAAMLVRLSTALING